MGNRAVITTPEREIGVYLHWNGGRDSIEAFLAYCDMAGFRPPSADSYGWASFVQTVANFFGGDGLSVGVMPYSDDERMNPGDNGIYVIEGWEIVDRIYPWEYFEEQCGYDLGLMMEEIDSAQPGGMRFGCEFVEDWLRSEILPRDEVEAGDKVLIEDWFAGRRSRRFVVIGNDEGKPFPQPKSGVLGDRVRCVKKKRQG